MTLLKLTGPAFLLDDGTIEHYWSNDLAEPPEFIYPNYLGVGHEKIIKPEESSSGSKSALSLNISLPKNMDREALQKTSRQTIIEEKLLKCYATEISSIISRLVVENCNGCIIQHGSQKQHPCLMMESEDRLWTYFDDAVSKISEADVMKSFVESLDDMQPKVNGLELLKYTCGDWRTVFLTDQLHELEQETLKLL